LQCPQEKEDKARAYLSVFRLYIELGDIDSAFLVFQRMKSNHDIVPVEPELFVQLIAATAEKGYFW
jgi:pentatricopeptide repeat protein